MQRVRLWRKPVSAWVSMWLVVFSTMAAGMTLVTQIQYQSNEAFIAQAFGRQQPQWKMLRLTGALRQQVEDILTHPYAGARLRYWVDGQRTAWIIDEIGKDQPITMGLVVQGDAIEQVKILVYREERGGEVHQDFFTRQFERVTLTDSGGLSRSIDGITGATLSVDAVTRVARLVLVLHREVMGRPAQ